MLLRLFICLCLLSKPAAAAEVTVAVAANFLTTARDLVALYETESNDRIVLVHGSTGRLAAQIQRGAPFDVFLSADSLRPADLERSGVATSVAPYAIGRLVFATQSEVGDWPEVMDPTAPFALANPALAPYGVAAMAALSEAGYGVTGSGVILGDSVGQVAGFLVTGNVKQGFVAAAQVPLLPDNLRPVPVPVPGNLLIQSAALVSEDASARAFYDWLSSDAARVVIANAAYDLPDTARP